MRLKNKVILIIASTRGIALPVSKLVPKRGPFAIWQPAI